MSTSLTVTRSPLRSTAFSPDKGEGGGKEEEFGLLVGEGGRSKSVGRRYIEVGPSSLLSPPQPPLNGPHGGRPGLPSGRQRPTVALLRSGPEVGAGTATRLPSGPSGRRAAATSLRWRRRRGSPPPPPPEARTRTELPPLPPPRPLPKHRRRLRWSLIARSRSAPPLLPSERWPPARGSLHGPAHDRRHSPPPPPPQAPPQARSLKARSWPSLRPTG
jgi:hypothetical protein